MGVDFQHVKYVVHYGPSNNLTGHLQEAGRAGRDGEEAYHITVYHGRHLTTCEADIKAAVRKSLKSCCRVAFLENLMIKYVQYHHCITAVMCATKAACVQMIVLVVESPFQTLIAYPKVKMTNTHQGKLQRMKKSAYKRHLRAVVSNF
ncbi:hypothetical protein OS493_020819 [Desmophyllum pertusum]|uniref:DNA 3'-5' helicase n=1 Tax=Desmophyllum pertusum TaxID=174260 RepID=A0A9W9YEM2_9CNID|nr:hypothetical protein OS493_020819 [Desmophyllum pertusum]